MEIVPFDLEAHQELAELYEELEERQGAVLERRAILALDPTDRAEAHYRLAVAMAEAGDRTEARSQLSEGAGDRTELRGGSGAPPGAQGGGAKSGAHQTRQDDS